MHLPFPLRLSGAQQRAYKVSAQHCRLRNTASLVASFSPSTFLFNPKNETDLFGKPSVWTAFFGLAITGIILSNFVQYCRGKELSVIADVFVVLCSTICNFVSLYIYIVRLEDGKDSLKGFEVTVSVWVIVAGSDMASRWIDLCRWSYSLWRNRVDKTSYLPVSSLQQDIELQDCSTSSPNNMQESEDPVANNLNLELALLMTRMNKRLEEDCARTCHHLWFYMYPRLRLAVSFVLDLGLIVVLWEEQCNPSPHNRKTMMEII